VDTPQQSAIVGEFRSGTENVAAIARAGTGKTSTIVRGIAARPPRTRATLCAFSKGIADELARRVRDPFVKVKTLHAVGYGAVLRAFGRQVPNKHRERNIAARIADIDEDDEAAESIGRIAQMGKEIAPAEATDVSRLAEIAVDFGLAGEEDDAHPLGLAVRAQIASEVVRASLAVSGEISFSDMLYLPIALELSPDESDLVVVDEAQDMNLAHHQLAERMRRRSGRIVIVGDPRQAIYSWRGAAPGALEQFAARLRAKILGLTVTFRCGRAIVAEARKIVQDIEAAPGAIDGVVRSSQVAEMLAAVRPGDFLLSRTNAPLIRMCLGIRRRGGNAIVASGDLEAGLVGIVRSVARAPMSGVAFLVALRRWRGREVDRALKAGRKVRADLIADQADTLEEIAVGAHTVDGIVANIHSLFVDDGKPSTLCSTVHKAKGREADRVWILEDTFTDRASSPQEELEQANLRYVAVTRARRELVYTTP